MRETHPPTREEALRRLAGFLPHAGRDYASRRNYDLPGHPYVSVLSPYIRHRLVTESEVLASVLGRFSRSTAEKFIQEVFWRTYWKGWLERRPGVWTDYRRGVHRGLDRIGSEGGLRRTWQAACTGDTGIDAFDHWARELVTTGYMHNHARMWFASIWIFTLELPWELGADFFLRHLLDGDPASNTLSWRWVAGLQTPGKHYLARGANIAKYTEGRFNPGYLLNTGADPLTGHPPPAPRVLPETGARDLGKRTGLVLGEDDLSPGWLVAGQPFAATLMVSGVAGRSPLAIADPVARFTEGAFADCLERHAGNLGDVTGAVRAANAADMLDDWAANAGLDAIVMPHAPVGPLRDALRGPLEERRITSVLRPYDRAAWPHATAGFFKFKAKIPQLIAELNLAPV